MTLIHYNADTGAVIGAYSSSCDNVPEPHISVSSDEWRQAANLKDNKVLDGKLIPGREWTDEELGVRYSKLSVMRELKAIPATIREGVEGTLWDVVWQKLQELDQVDEWLATSWLASTDTMVKQLMAWLKARYPELGIDGILKRCHY